MLLYTAKGTSALLVPLANLSKASTGSWNTVFMTAAVVNFAVVLAALFILKPACRKG
jgi:OFA family oxalate/formate antiporter-like MFS transporter